MPGTIHLHRVLRATPERAYRAFLDPEAMVKWLPPNGFTGKVHHLDALPRLAILAGKSRLPSWQSWSRRRFRMSHEARKIAA